MNCFARVCCCGELWAEPFCWFLVFKGHWRTLKDTEGISWRPKNRMGWRSLDVPIKAATDCKKHHLRPDVEGLWCIISGRETPVGATECRDFPCAASSFSSDHQIITESIRICENQWGFAGISYHQRRRTGRPWKQLPSCPAMPSYAQPSRLESRWIGVRPGPGWDGGNGTRVASVALKRQVISSWIISNLL